MSEQKRERQIKVLVKRNIWLEDNKPTKAGSVIMLSKEQVKHYGAAVTRDLPEGEDE